MHYNMAFCPAFKQSTKQEGTLAWISVLQPWGTNTLPRR